MIEILNLQSIVPRALIRSLSANIIDPMLRDIAESVRDKWVRMAAEKLVTSRGDYTRGIQPVEYSPGQAIITLVGVMPLLIEKGMKQQDMHKTLLGPKVPTVPMGQRGAHASKDGGRYRAIPFRHATPGSIGLAGQPMGQVSSSFRGTEQGEEIKALAKDVYEAAKALDASRTSPYSGKTHWGGRLNTEPLNVPKLKAIHSTDIYSGMVRMEKEYQTGTQNQYATFRTIATGPDGNARVPGKWIRPATPGVHLVKQVSQYARKITKLTFQAYVAGLK